MKVENAIAVDENTQLTPTQISGLCALVHIAHRESTSILYQLNEWGFIDVPRSEVHRLDQVSINEQLEAVIEMAAALLEELQQGDANA